MFKTVITSGGKAGVDEVKFQDRLMFKTVITSGGEAGVD